jgi:dTDP-4-amino-4,6-dideoxygalactose transaminase
LQFYSKKYGYKPSDYPNARELYFKNLALPFYNAISPEDIKRVVNTLKEVLN